MKKTIVTITMAVVMALGTTMANAGIIVSEFNNDKKDTQVNCGIMVSDLGGILVSDFGGIIVSELGGIIVAGLTKGDPCQEKSDKGIMVSDLGGIIVSE